MSKKGYSRPGLFGTMKHYDADGNFIGESRPGWLGSMENYDANGNKTGESRPGWLGSMENEECRIDSIAQSWSTISNAGDNDKKGDLLPDCFGNMNHYNENGHKTGHSDKGIFGGWNHFDE